MGQFQTGFVIYGADVDGKVAADTPVFTAPQGFCPSQIQILLKNATGVVLGSTISIGTNAPLYNNISTLTLLTPLNLLTNILNLNTINPGVQIQTNETVYAKVVTPAIAGTYNFQTIIMGYPI